MKVIICENYDELSLKAFEVIKELVTSKPDCVLGLATGSSPVGLYKNMIKDHKENGTSYKDVKSYNLDEYVGIDRMVRVLDPKTREDVARPLYEVATTHTARKTFIGNLYKQVKDPNLIASMSGHSEGSRAFARYRKIDDEMKKELVNLLD